MMVNEDSPRVSAESILRHNRLVEQLDDWSRSVRAAYSAQMRCGRGCAGCCHGLFDISIFDALRIVTGFDSLSAQTRDIVTGRASTLQNLLMSALPDLGVPYYLDSLSPERIDEAVDAAGETRCVFLSDDDSCLIYEYRPITCRLEGIPMVDVQDGLFSDWCECNFRQGVTEEMMRFLQLDYYEIQAIEQDSAIFIPSVVCALANGQRTLIVGC